MQNELQDVTLKNEDCLQFLESLPNNSIDLISVSYTHLTLPTIYSV